MANLRKMKGATPGTAKPVRADLADLLVSLRHETSLSHKIAGLALGGETDRRPPRRRAWRHPARPAGDKHQTGERQPDRGEYKCQDIRQSSFRFLTAVKVSGLKPVQRSIKIELSPAWEIWCRSSRESARTSAYRASFRAPAERIDVKQLPSSFQEDVESNIAWCGGTDVFAADARSRALAPRTLKLRRNQIQAAVTALVGRRSAITSKPACCRGPSAPVTEGSTIRRS